MQQPRQGIQFPNAVDVAWISIEHSYLIDFILEPPMETAETQRILGSSRSLTDRQERHASGGTLPRTGATRTRRQILG